MSATDLSNPPGPRLRVLIVEDEFMVALLLEDMIASLGHEVVGPVARLEQAVEMAQRETLDVAILDVNLNGQETYPVAAALAARNISFVFATGYNWKTLPEAFGNKLVLQKPFQENDLRKVLAEVVPRKEK